MTIAARVFLGAVLLAAGTLKAADPSFAVTTAGAYGILPAKGSLVVGFLLPGVEIVAGAALLTGFLTRGAAILAAALSVVFLLATCWAHFMRLDITCGCFGPLSRALEARWATALLDVAMAGASWAVLKDPRLKVPS
jgi:uncharacterized membrane protein YphA (DoxX/SURF4 family)